MFKLIAVLFITIAIVAAKPKPLVAVAPGVVTATSSQVFARNYNGFAAPLLASPYVSAAYTSAPVAAEYTLPVGYSAYSPYAAYSTYVL